MNFKAALTKLIAESFFQSDMIVYSINSLTSMLQEKLYNLLLALASINPMYIITVE